MDSRTKSAIKTMVLALRKQLEDDVAGVLRRYGIFADRDWLPVEQLPVRDAALLQTRRRVAATVEAEMARGINQRAATHWYIREVAFTFLNRLVGLKCLEVRDLIPEVITTRPEYGGRSLRHRDFRHDHPALAQQRDDALPGALRATFARVDNEMIGVLFDPDSESSAIWPRYPVLREAIERINTDLAREVWQEDEIIGWIYQFYNTEEKEAIRSKGRPELPIEVAVINQFFTPRWIVKFLVDNTLGRLWLEMHPDSECVREKCDYLVPDPLPVGEEAPDEDAFALDPDSPINNAGALPRREAKPVTEIRLIDPACGTMHFGYYAFEVFQEIYRDARENGWPAWDDAAQTAPVEAEVPSLILAHNLYGVDIDLRAVQLAALSLYMKAKTSNRNAKVVRLNLVAADAIVPIDGALSAFLVQYADDRKVQEAVRQILSELENVAAVGSLLRVEERLRDLLTQAGAWVEGLTPVQGRLPGTELVRRQLRLNEADGASGDGWGVHYTLERLLDDLHSFANVALQTNDLNAQLFAYEAEKSVHLLDVLLNDYDVVVMNPPYGRTLENVHEYLEQVYPVTKHDLYMAFVERAQDLTRGSGYVGALVSKTFLTLERSRGFRKQIMLDKSDVIACLDLGTGVLDDATVETAAFVSVMPPSVSPNRIGFVDLLTTGDKEDGFVRFLKTGASSYWPRQVDLERLPGAAFIYSLPPTVESLFRGYPPLDLGAYERVYGESHWDDENDQIAYVRSGLVPPNYAQFVRYHWEISPQHSTAWVTLAKGGPFQTYYADTDYSIRWENNGEEAKKYSADHYGSASRYIKNEALFFREGVTYSRISSIGLSGRYLPRGCIFSETGPAVLASEGVSTWYLLALVNSHFACYLADAIHPGRKYEVLHLATIPFAPPDAETSGRISDLARGIWQRKRDWDSGNELCRSYTLPWLLQANRGDLLTSPHCLSGGTHVAKQLSELLRYIGEVENAIDTNLRQTQSEIDETIYRLYGISDDDRGTIENAIRDRPSESVWPQMQRKPLREKQREHVRRLLSYCVLESLKADEDGIIPLFEGAGNATALELVRTRLSAEFGEEASFQLEDDAGRLMGRGVANWLDGQFIRWHTKLYRKRPIIWHIASPSNTFGVFIYYHKLDGDTLPKVRNLYVRRAQDAAQRALLRARDARDEAEVGRREDLLDELRVLDERLERVISGSVGYKPPKWAEGPYRNGIYDPVIDDGVAVNLMPLQEGGLLRYAKTI